MQIADYFPEDSVVCYHGISGEEGLYSRVGRRQLVKTIEDAEDRLEDFDYLRLEILYKCYLEIVWCKEWPEENKLNTIKEVLAFASTAFDDEDETAMLYDAMLLEDGKPVSSKAIAVRLFGQISSITTFSLVRGRIVTKTVFPNKWDCCYYILMQYITHPELQNGDGTRRIAYCARCGAEFLQEHKARRYCDICGSGAIRQRAFRERRKEAIQRKGRGKR